MAPSPPAGPQAGRGAAAPAAQARRHARHPQPWQRLHRAISARGAEHRQAPVVRSSAVRSPGTPWRGAARLLERRLSCCASIMAASACGPDLTLRPTGCRCFCFLCRPRHHPSAPAPCQADLPARQQPAAKRIPGRPHINAPPPLGWRHAARLTQLDDMQPWHALCSPHGALPPSLHARSGCLGKSLTSCCSWAPFGELTSCCMWAYPSLQVLRYEASCQPHLLGSSGARMLGAA